VTQAEAKADARKAAFARRKQAFDTAPPDTAAHLCRVLAAHRGLPLSGFLPIRTEIDPTPAMAQAVTLGPVGVPVVDGPGLPLRFALWTPGCTLVRGPFGAMIPADPQWMTPRVVIVPLVAFTRAGGRLAMAGGSMIARCKVCAPGTPPPWPSDTPLPRKRPLICRWNPPTSRLT